MLWYAYFSPSLRLTETTIIPKFYVAFRPQSPYGLLGVQDVHRDFHTNPEFWVIPKSYNH